MNHNILICSEPRTHAPSNAHTSTHARTHTRAFTRRAARECHSCGCSDEMDVHRYVGIQTRSFPYCSYFSLRKKQKNTHTLTHTHAHTADNKCDATYFIYMRSRAQQRRTFHSGTLELIQSFVLASLGARASECECEQRQPNNSHMVHIADARSSALRARAATGSGTRIS